MLSKKGNPKDEVFNSSVVSKFGEPSQWNVEVLVRFKCGLEEAFGEEIFEVSDVLSPSEFAGKIAQIFAAQIKQSGGKFLLIKSVIGTRKSLHL
uniref:Uncharacterized protein n=1 Tax=Ditylenchus dipsaci TaxID=166011 RepID=A0A915CUN2_9BILA